MTRWPDFFIVGAPKCGTTALYEYLRQHPSLFLPFHKEPLFFGDDLTRRYGRLTTDEYLALFNEADEGQRIGEASAWYLYSESAAREIASVSPSASIIAMVRQPVDMMYAQHSQLLFNRQEEIEDFGSALAAEPARRRGERLPPGPLRPETLRYRETSRYADQLQRYFDVFGRERVHVIVFDDFRDATSDPCAPPLSSSASIRMSRSSSELGTSTSRPAARCCSDLSIGHRVPSSDSHHGSADTLGHTASAPGWSRAIAERLDARRWIQRCGASSPKSSSQRFGSSRRCSIVLSQPGDPSAHDGPHRERVLGAEPWRCGDCPRPHCHPAAARGTSHRHRSTGMASGC